MRRIVTLAVTTVFAIGSACSGASSSARSLPDFSGRWVLRSVNGTALPFTTTQTSSSKVEIVSDVIRAMSNANFEDTMTVRTTDNGQVTTSAIPRSGVWVLDGSTVTFTFLDDGRSSTAMYAGTALTVSSAGRQYVYSRN